MRLSPRPGAVFLCFLVLFVLISAAIPLFVNHEAESWVWEGYYLLLYEDGDDSIEKYLDAASIGPYLSQTNVMVEYNRMPQTVRVPLQSLPALMDELDPRWDSYLKALPDYFTCYDDGKQWNLVYIRNHYPVFRMKRELKTALEYFSGSWILDGYETQSYGIKAGLFIVLLIGMMFSTELKRKIYLTGLLPLGLMFAAGDSYGMMIAVLLCLGWEAVFSPLINLFPGCPSPWKTFLSLYGRRLYFLIFILVPVFLLILPAPRRLELVLLIVSVFSTQFFFLMAVHGYEQYKKQRRLHTLFYPKVLSLASDTAASVNIRLVLFAVSIIILLPVFLNLSQPLSQMKVPYPLPLEGADDLAYDEIERLSRQPWLSNLPDLSDYLTHAAFQQTFMYNPDYIFPKQGSEIILQHFRLHEDGIITRPEVVFQYDESWFSSLMKITNYQTIENLLMEQNKPVMITWMVPDYFHVSIPMWIRMIISASLLSPYLFAGLAALRRFRSGKFLLLIRRKHQSA